jgi:hypothetical protein
MRRELGIIFRASRRHGLGHAEIRDDGVARGQEHVIGLEVAVRDAMLVRVRRGRGDVAQHAHGAAQREQLTAPQPRAERFAGDERHRVERNAVHHPRGENRHNAGMLESGRDLDLTPEPLRVDLPANIRRENLHDDAASEGGVSHEVDA